VVAVLLAAAALHLEEITMAGSLEGVVEDDMKFLKKLWTITGDLIWTIVGSVIVIITLSGDTQKIALYLTVTGGILHYIYKLLDGSDND
jgi:hypothetical protein